MSRLIKLAFVLIILYFLPCSSQAQNTYTNPILSGFYPDPSICRVGTDYYLVNSTFSFFPGIPVFHSKDLVNWKLIGHAMSRPEQLQLERLGVSGGIFAPAIRHYNGLFYITCTVVGGKGNFIITAQNPAGPWSNPSYLPSVSGIDPSPFFDEDGKAYIVYNSNPPQNKSLYDGHRTIRLVTLDINTLTASNSNQILVNGGSDISKKPIWIEGPHLYKVKEYYYLMAAEGGTGSNHSEVVFRSKKVDSPYEPYEHNPILTQRTANPNRKNPITSTGHADLVQLPDGSWQAVFLGTRPYQGDYYNTGRETFLAPVKWIGGWPVINAGQEIVQNRYPAPLPAQKTGETYSGNFSYQDDFTDTTLRQQWVYLRTPNEKWWSLTNKKNWIALQVRPQTAGGTSNPSFIARRQQHMQFVASTVLQFNPQDSMEKAGIIIFQNDAHFYYLCQSVEKGQPVVQLYQSASSRADSNHMILLAKKPLQENVANPLQLKITGNKRQYSFYYSSKNGQWLPIKENVDGQFLSTQVAGGFVGTMIALYTTSLGEQSTSKAYYDWFKYIGKDDFYK